VTGITGWPKATASDPRPSSRSDLRTPTETSLKNRALMSLSAPDDHTRALEQLDEIAQAASHSIGEVREIAYNLRPYHLERLGLTKSIEAMVKRASTSDGVRFTAEIEPIDGLFQAGRFFLGHGVVDSSEVRHG